MRYKSVVAISNRMGLAVQTQGSLSWQGNAVCYDFDAGTIKGAQLVKLSAPHARITDPRYYLFATEAALDALFNRTICGHAYRHRDTGDLLSVGTVDGEFAGELMHGFAMIDAKAGYRLRAAAD